jgi:hypothetical protein
VQGYFIYFLAVMRFLPAEDQVVVDRALALGLNDAVPAPAYLSPNLCTALSFLLAVPSLGFSLVLVPILWVAQYDRTKHRIMGLRKQLEKDSYRIGLSD